MSRTTEYRLSGWVKDSNLFDNDLRFVNLIEHKGAVSYLIYDIMRGLICSNNGYYAILDDNLILRIHRTLGRCSKGQAHIKGIILYFGEIGILDKCSLENNILTSVDIQENWLVAKKAKRARITNNLEHWLLIDTLPMQIDNNCSNNNYNCSNNNNNCYNNNYNCTLDKTRQELLVNKINTINNNISGVDNSKTNNISADLIDKYVDKGYDTDLYLADNIFKRKLAEMSENDAYIEECLFNSTDKKEMYDKCMQLLSNACYDKTQQKYLDSVVDYKLFRKYVDDSSLTVLRGLFWLVLNAENVGNSAYYMRGIIVNKMKESEHIDSMVDNAKHIYGG